MTDLDRQLEKRNIRPFNSPLECGLRTLFILEASRSPLMDLQRIVAYDYLLVHSGDIENGPKSLHPAVPHRGTELLVKRSLIQAGLNQLIAKELVQVNFTAEGFFYSATALTSAFVKLLKSPYAVELKIRAHWVENYFHIYGHNDLEVYMARNIGRWGAEFEALSAIDSLEL